MKFRVIIVSFLLILICSAIVSAATSTTSSSTTTTGYVSNLPAASPLAAGLVYVSGYTTSPEVFYPGETGTVTVQVTNAASTAMALNQLALIDPHIQVVNQGSFVTATTIGPGATANFTFIITVGNDVPDGTYFPLFSAAPAASTYGGTSVSSQITMKVDSADVRASISSKPAIFGMNETDTVDVSVANPRLGDISDVQIVASGNGNDVSPAESFVGPVPAGTSVQVPFAITPHQQSDVIFNVSFRNGDNIHTTSVVLPMNTGESLSAAMPVINNVALVSSGNDSYTMTGDVTNAGITDASGMVLYVGAPATPVQPYSNYAVGALASDDFSSFTLTFTAKDISAVPVTVQWKDAKGNTLTTTTTLNLRSLVASTSRSSRGSNTTSSFYPIIGGLIIIAIVLWYKRAWIVAQFRKQ